MAVGPRMKKRRVPVVRGKPEKLHEKNFKSSYSSMDGELRHKKAGVDVASVHKGSMTDIIKEVASRRQRHDKPF